MKYLNLLISFLRFKMSTVFMITHNIEKTMKCDIIIVLESGLVKEFDSPDNLLNDKSTAYYEMAKESGLVQL
jgi:ATP-binding cassette subfamily C (CFTR/MRP) protein 1